MTAGSHRKVQRRRERRLRRPQLSRVGGIVLVFAALVAALVTYDNRKAHSDAVASLDGIACQAGMSINYHIHVHLTLYDRGRLVVVPAYAGIPIGKSTAALNAPCLYQLHTHADSGVIHVESPTQQRFTLGEFFAIWSATAQSDARGGPNVKLDDSFVRDLRAAKPQQIHVYHSGVLLSSGYADIALTGHEVVTVEIGAPLGPPTTSFDWAHWNGL